MVGTARRKGSTLGSPLQPWGLKARRDELEKAVRWPILALVFIWSDYRAPAIKQKQQFLLLDMCREQCWVSNRFFSSTTKLRSGKKNSIWSKFKQIFFFFKFSCWKKKERKKNGTIPPQWLEPKISIPFWAKNGNVCSTCSLETKITASLHLTDT